MSGSVYRQCVVVQAVYVHVQAMGDVQAVCGSTSCTYRQCVRGELQVVCGSTYRQCVGVCTGSVWEYVVYVQVVCARQVRTGSVWEYVEAVCGSTSCTNRQCVGVHRGSVWEYVVYVHAVCGST